MSPVWTKHVSVDIIKNILLNYILLHDSRMRVQKDFSPILNLKTAYSSRKFHYLDETASLVAPHSPSLMPNYSGTMIPPLPALQFSSTNTAQYEFLRISSPITFFILFLVRHLQCYEGDTRNDLRRLWSDIF